MALGLTPKEIVEKGEYPLLAKADHWERVSLKDIASVQNGCALKSEYFDRDDGVPLIRIRDIARRDTEHRYLGNYEEEYVVRAGGILIGMDGDFLATRWKGGKALLNQRVCRLTCTTDYFDEGFFFLCLQPFLNAINAETSSVTVKHLSSRSIEAIPLPLPPLYEQKRIVAKIEELFSELDKGIESLKSAREQLKVYRQSVLKHAFEGKLTAQWRQENKDDLDPLARASANDIRNDIQTLDSYSIPDNWGWFYVENLLLEGPSNGRSVKDRVDGFPVLRLTALKDGRIDLAEYKHGDWSREGALQFIVRPGDFLLSRGNGSKHLVGRGGVVPAHQDEIAFPDTMVRLRIDPQMMHTSFFSLLWESRLVRSQIESAARTIAGIYKINQGHIKGFQVPVPSLNEQEAITGLLEEKLSVVEELERDLVMRLAASETLRQSILKKAFSGQLVPQDPNDEPASVLLERIKAEKAKQSPKPRRKRKPRKAAPA